MYFPNALRAVSVLLAVVSTVQAIPSFRAGGSGSKYTSYKTDTENDPEPDPATIPNNGTYDDVIGCKTLYDPKTMAKEERHFHKMRARLRSHHKGKYTDDNPYWFPIWFHVNYADETMKGGNVLAWQIEQQMYRLNLDFAGTGFKFKYMGTKRYHNPTWFYSGVGTDMALDQAQMTQKRIGDVQTLNVYTVGPFSPWYYAYAYYPSNYASWPGLDGVLTSIDVLPGGAQEGNNIGKILAHEVGHWLGLKHTFEGYSCSGPGDDVEDSPQHTGPSWGCEVKLNTCGGADELYDPVFNFMNYADRDYCMSQFTKGQIDRMWDQARVYRSVP